MLTTITARDIDDAYFQVLIACFDKEQAKKYKIEKGSFEGQYRYQLHSLTVRITNPETRPLSPIMPEGSSVVSPTTDEYINEYFSEYIFGGGEKRINEEYTYSEFIHPHLEYIVDSLKKNPHTNQLTINIGEPFQYKLGYTYDLPFAEPDYVAKSVKVYEDPPCMRVYSIQFDEGKINSHVFFRSWDIAAFPSNLGGIQLLSEYIAGETGYEPGEIYAYSSGLHCYEYYKSIAESRLGKDVGW
jgi:hypothetical protein